MPRILLVEDNPQWLEIVTALLRDNGYECVAVTSVKQAILSLEGNTLPELIILDIMLKDESGFDLLKYMKQFIRYRHLPIVMCSSMKERDAVIESVRLGAQDYILKPVKQELLLGKIKTILEAKKGVILVVSNDKTRIGLLTRILHRIGYLVMSVGSAAKALDELGSDTTVRMVIADMSLQQGDGLGLLAEVKTQFHATPVLMIPKRPGTADYESIISSGADGIIRIPFNGVEIANTIEVCAPALR